MTKKKFDINIREKDVNEYALLGQAAGLASLTGADRLSIRFDKDDKHGEPHLQIDAFKVLYGETQKRASLRIFKER